jgi:hypothetical protein
LRDWSKKDAEVYFERMISEHRYVVPSPAVPVEIEETNESSWLDEFSDDELEWFRTKATLNEDIGLDKDVSDDYLQGSVLLTQEELPAMSSLVELQKERVAASASIAVSETGEQTKAKKVKLQYAITDLIPPFDHSVIPSASPYGDPEELVNVHHDIFGFVSEEKAIRNLDSVGMFYFYCDFINILGVLRMSLEVARLWLSVITAHENENNSLEEQAKLYLAKTIVGYKLLPPEILESTLLMTGSKTKSEEVIASMLDTKTKF